tara:strand:+ start:239 stop:589 length:351 start_codon:yes stop_codon:yes gene_type:complete
MMQWDDRKGKYIQPFTKKKLLKNLIFNGMSLQWDFPKPKPLEYTEQELKELKEYLDTSDDDDDGVQFFDTWSGTPKEKKYYKELKLYKIQKSLNLILRLLPLIPVSGFLLGYGVII